jgi:hypothetical protein
MADTTPQAPPASEPNTPPSSAAEQARIRKERRQAKILAGGSTRLNKITGLGGGIQRDPPQPPPPPVSHADPEEVDISQHFSAPRATQRTSTQQSINDEQLRQMMLGSDPSNTPPPGTNPFAGFPSMPPPGAEGMPGADDPMMKMLQQMMGSMNDGGTPGAIPAFPGMPNMPPPGQQVPDPTSGDPSAYLWRIIHAVFALSLGLYIAFTTPFTGTKLERAQSTLAFDPSNSALTATSVHFFYIFFTVEVLLQTSRFWMEKGRIQQTGIMGMAMKFLPEPYKGYLTLGSRYFRIWTTVSGDAMVCVFVLGICAWLRGNPA